MTWLMWGGVDNGVDDVEVTVDERAGVLVSSAITEVGGRCCMSAKSVDGSQGIYRGFEPGKR